MKVSTYLFRQSVGYFNSSRCHSKTAFNVSQSDRSYLNTKSLHCYRNLYPWQSSEEFSKYLVSCIEYSDGGLLVLNKPFGIKIHSHDKPGARPKSDFQFIKSSVPECNYTVEDALPELQKHFNLENLSIIKSAEKYTSGIVLLSSSDKVTKKIEKSFNIAKFQKKAHLIHWGVTIGYPVVPYRKEKVGIKFVETENGKLKQPIIVTDLSKKDCKLKRVYPVHVDTRTICANAKLSTSLIEIASSSVKWHFVRVYASSRASPILGDIMYGSRMKTFLGIPVKVPLQSVCNTGFEPLPAELSEALNIPKGMSGQLMIPTMLHLRTIILPNYHKKDQDFTVTANLPHHFKWTVNKLDLLCDP